MSVDQDRKATASARRATIIRVVDDYLANPESRPMALLKERLTKARTMVAGSDIDGLVSAMMLASISPWRVGALVMRSGSVLLSPQWKDVEALLSADVYGVDVFSPRFPSISNHPVLFGVVPGMPSGWLRTALEEFDDYIVSQCNDLGSINLSVWAGIRARLGSRFPNGFPYKYPLGTAQALLAVLEVLGQAPRFYDRQYLPWLVANCDGGLETIRRYHWNVEGWWSALAAGVGPASQSEAVFKLAVNQRATEFVDVDLRLRRDYGERANALTTNWDLAASDIGTVATAMELVHDLSGWPDPFAGGASSLSAWQEIAPTRNVLETSGLTAVKRERVQVHLAAASRAIHMNFSQFRERGIYLGWMLATREPDVERELGAVPPLPLVMEPTPLFQA